MRGVYNVDTGISSRRFKAIKHIGKTLGHRGPSVFVILGMVFSLASSAGIYNVITTIARHRAASSPTLSSAAPLHATTAATAPQTGNVLSMLSPNLNKQLAKQAKQQLAAKPVNRRHIKLLASNRSANTRAYLNADGSKSIVYTAAATSFKNQNGNWQNINNSLTEGPNGVWHTTANAWIASFGDSATYGIAITEGGSTFRELPQAANDVKPLVVTKGGVQTVTYKNLWYGVDLSYKINGSEVKESINVKDQTAATNYAFAYSGATLTPVSSRPGYFALGGAFSGMQIAAPTVSTHDKGFVKDGSAVTQTVHGTLLDVSLDQAWFHQQPSKAFPLVIDPTVFSQPVGSSYDNFNNLPSSCGPGSGCGNSVGYDATGTGLTWRFIYNVSIPTSAGQYLVSAQLHLQELSGVTNSTPITVDHASCTNDFNCVDTSPTNYGEVTGAVATSGNIELASIYNAAISAGDTDPNLIVRGDESGPNSYKMFDDTQTSVTFTYENLPTQPTTAGAETPANGGTSVTTQPIFDVTGSTDPDGPGLQYRYIVGTGTSTPTNDPFHIQQGVTGVIADSGLLNQPAWVTPANVLQDGHKYYWQPVVWDTYNNAPQVYGPVSSFTVNLRNGQDGTQASDTLGPVGVDFATGNVSTSNATHSTTALGGDIGLGLDYNSPQRSGPGLIGQYWNNPSGNLVFPTGTAPDFTRTDPNVNFAWGSNSPDPGVINSTNYLVRWTGYFVAPVADTYQFGTTSVDRSRIFVNGSPTAYVDGWSSDPTNLYGSTMALAAGQVVPITYEYAEITGASAAQLLVKTTDGAVPTGPVSATMLQTGPQSVASPHGLLGQYYTDDGTHTFDSTNLNNAFLTRTDTSMNMNWGYGSPVPNGPTDNFLVKWSGTFTAPATDTYTFGAGSDDGVQITVGGTMTLNAWSDHVASPVLYGTSVSLTKGQAVPTIINYYEHGGTAQMGLYVKRASQPSAPDTIVNSNWLSPSTEVLPDGWNLSLDADGTANYDFATIDQNSVTLYDASGATHEYTYANGGYTPPAGESGHMVRNADGTITLEDSDGQTYVFNIDGTIKSVTSATDDLHPAALQYTYGSDSGSPVHLQQITDGVTSTRYAHVYYTGASQCGTIPSGFVQGPSNMVCAVITNDSRATYFYYDANGNLARISKPGNDNTDYLYQAVNNSAGVPIGYQLASVRDDLANDAVAAGVRANDNTTFTNLTYDNLGRVASVTAPEATTGATSIAHTYQYLPNATMMHVTGATEPNGFTREVKYDSTDRTTDDIDVANLDTKTVWDPVKDLVGSTTDPTGLETTDLYDYGDRQTDTYGPAPSAWFDNNPADSTYHQPLSAYTSQVPHQQTAYDEGIHGLATAYYDVTTASNGTGTTTKNFFGAPKAHATGIGAPGGDVVQTWNGTPPFTPDSGDGWGAELTGDINLATTGTYAFRIYANDGVRLWVDDTLVIDDWNDGAPRSHGMVSGYAGFTTTPGSQTEHRIRLQYYDAPGDNNATLQLYMTPPGGTETSALGSLLTPMYGLATTQTTYDSSASVGNSVTTNNYGSNPELGLLQSSTVDPSGLNLTTSYTYEPQGGTGSYLRQLSKTLPGGATTNYTYYGGTETRQNPCNTSQTFQEGGQLKLTTGPDPDGSGPQTGVVTENVYDDAGNIVATRTNTDPWECETYDSRGRLTQDAIPALANTPHVTRSARTVTYNYAVGGNPLVTSVSDASGTVTTTVDLLGRTVSYADTQAISGTNHTTTTNYAFDSLGRPASQSGFGNLTYAYDNTNRLTAVKIAGTTVASPTYDAFGRLQSVTYPTAGKLALSNVSYDNLGNESGVTYQEGSTSVTKTVSDSDTFSQSGQVVSGTQNGAAETYAYDKADRLTNATIGSSTFAYTFGTPTACTGTYNPNAGMDSNRTSETTVINSVHTTTTYCYDYADRLIKSSDAKYASDTYDSHGNLSAGNTGSNTFEYDSSDRLVYQGAISATSTFDPLNRVLKSGDANTYYVYGDDNDSPIAVYNNTYTLAGWFVALPGNVNLVVAGSALNTPGSTANTYLLPNLHGDVITQAGGSGIPANTVDQFDPFGNTIGSFTLTNNAQGSDAYGWLGADKKLSYMPSANNTIQMGARLYLPEVGRFAQTDPVDGGNANAYVYPADPVNESDPTGNCFGALSEFLPLCFRSGFVQRLIRRCNSSFACSVALLAADPEAGGADLAEELAIKEAKSFAPEGQTLEKIVLNDPRFQASRGWVKKQYIVRLSRGRKIVVHYVYNVRTKVSADFKIK